MNWYFARKFNIMSFTVKIRMQNRFFGGTNENSTGAHYKDV